MTGAEALYLVIIYKSEHNFPAGFKKRHQPQGSTGCLQRAMLPQ